MPYSSISAGTDTPRWYLSRRARCWRGVNLRWPLPVGAVSALLSAGCRQTGATWSESPQEPSRGWSHRPAFPEAHGACRRCRRVSARYADRASRMSTAKGVPAVRIRSCTAASRAGGRRTVYRVLGMVQASQGTGAHGAMTPPSLAYWAGLPKLPTCAPWARPSGTMPTTRMR
jgi:hypothetical protein